MADSVKNEKQNKPSFFKGVKAEFKKIVWPNRDDVVKQSVAVAIIAVVLGLIIAALDFVMQFGIDILVNL